jgi:hypothetical protein
MQLSFIHGDSHSLLFVQVFPALSPKSQMLCLVSLPYEVLSYIVSNIDFDDVFSLGLTCKALKFLLTEESICKSIVQVRLCGLSHRSKVGEIQS